MLTATSLDSPEYASPTSIQPRHVRFPVAVIDAAPAHPHRQRAGLPLHVVTPSTSRHEPRHVHPPFRWLAERAFDDRTKPAPLTGSGRSDVPGCAVPEGLRHAPVFPRFDVSGQFTRIHGPFPAPSVSSGRPADSLSQYFPVSYEIHRPVLQLYSCNYKDKEIGQITDFGNSGLSTGSAG